VVNAQALPSARAVAGTRMAAFGPGASPSGGAGVGLRGVAGLTGASVGSDGEVRGSPPADEGF
jgi:hypothetical protein